MSNFTPAEIEYLTSQQLGRLATVNKAGEPHVVPVGFRYNANLGTIDIGGANMSESKKFRNASRQGQVAFVVDDLLPPWSARGVEIRGHAETLAAGNKEMIQDGFPVQIRIHAHHIVGWGIDTDAFHPLSRSITTSAM